MKTTFSRRGTTDNATPSRTAGAERGEVAVKKKRMAKARSRVSVTVSGSCWVFASHVVRCPLCRVEVPANTVHTCGTEST